jgi:hypothetical protein
MRRWRTTNHENDACIVLTRKSFFSVDVEVIFIAGDF